MTYRSEALASQTRISTLERDIEEARTRAAAAEAAHADSLARLVRLRDGVAEDDDLDERGFGRVQSRLVLVAAIGLGAALCAGAVVIGNDFPEPHLTLAGVRNLFWLLANRVNTGDVLGASVLLVGATPWFVLPWLGARGLARRRRWGWVVAVAACAIWLLTPLFPLAAAILVRLFARQVRDVYFAG